MPGKFSYYNGPITNKIPSKEITLKSAIAEIRSDKHKDTIERLRASTNESTQKTLKKNLNYFTFSGIFKKRILDGLIQHSGYIVIDFDHVENLEEVFKSICEDVYTAACFVSPSGTGLKVVVYIDQRQHKESFLQLEQYYKEIFGLEADKSGKDVTRSCFVSYDPNAFMREKAEIFPLTSTKAAQEEKKPTFTPGPPAETDSILVKKEWEKNFKRAEYVVQQIEREKKDLTAIYDDWVLICFSLATFGEPGREMFHSISRFHAEYTRVDADKKFDDAIKNTRFTTPIKFFKIAEQYGLESRIPKTIAQAKVENEKKQFITGDDKNVEVYNTYGFWEDRGVYWSLDNKNVAYDVSNFTMRILWHVKTGAETAYRLIVIKNVHGYESEINMNTDDFVSVSSFRKVIARRGNFIWKGSDVDLCRLSDMLQREERPTKLIQQLGWNKRGKFYAFANGVFDMHTNNFIPVDEYGILEHVAPDKHGVEVKSNFFIPAVSKIYEDQEDQFVNDRKFRYTPNKHTHDEWANLFGRVYGHQGEIALVFYYMAIYSDIIFRDLGDRFPLFFIYGMRGSGKGSMLQSLMKMFGEGQSQLMMGSVSTTKSLFRKFAQYINGLIWLDEFKNNVKPVFIESAKNLYDRVGYERAKVDNSYETETTPVLSACVMSGQEVPADAALYSRLILTSFMATTYTDTQRELYSQLVRMQSGGLSNITVELLHFRSWVEAHFKNQYEKELKTFVKDVNNNEIDERLYSSYAALITIAQLMSTKVKLPFEMLSFRDLCKKNLLEQFFILKGSDDVGKFWEVIDYLCSAGIIVEDRHFKLKNGYIYISLKNVYHYYAKTLIERRDATGLDKVTLEKYLESDTNTFVKKTKQTIGGAYIWTHQFKYPELDIDLIKIGDDKMRIAKHVEMGVRIDDEQMKMNLPDAKT